MPALPGAVVVFQGARSTLKKTALHLRTWGTEAFHPHVQMEDVTNAAEESAQENFQAF